MSISLIFLNLKIIATIKSFTSLKQSKKLAEILPLESADMVLPFKHSKNDENTPEYAISRNYIEVYNGIMKLPGIEKEDVCKLIRPCWSLAALSEFILPYIVGDDGNNYKFYLSKDGLDRWIAYYKSGDVSIHICEESDNMIDVILEMVCWLKKEEYI